MPAVLRPLEPAYRPVGLEREVRAFWERNRIYERARRRPGRPFFFVDGPPYTTGAIHLGTAWNKIIKDAVLRHRTMAGFCVRDPSGHMRGATPGWDMHGLPIEVKVEEALGFESKKEIEEYGVGRFIVQCKEFAEKNRKVMTKQFQRLGVWMNWEHPYRTVEPEYMEAAWSTLKRANQKGLLEQNYRVITQCPRCDTALAAAEIEYETITDPSIYVKFPLVDRPGVFLLVWTTTPWTLPGNMAVALHPNIKYVEVRRGNETFIVALDLVEKVPGLMGEGAQIVAERLGREMAGYRYRNPTQSILSLDHPVKGFFSPPGEPPPALTSLVSEVPPPYQVITAQFVQVTEGTGCVHIAPIYGEDDYWAIRRWGQDVYKRSVPIFYPVDEQGRFTDFVPILKGEDSRKGNRVIIDALRQANTLFHFNPISHRYPHCWRCKTPLLYIATNQWFLKISQTSHSHLRQRMIAEAKEVIWIPEWAGSARFQDSLSLLRPIEVRHGEEGAELAQFQDSVGRVLDEAHDWCISRQRYWGIPLPIWRCSNHLTTKRCPEIAVLETKKELEGISNRVVKDLHRPFVDEITWPCGRETCGGTMKRVPDIFDVWFDSAVASWAVQGWRSKDGKPKPSHFICEGHDQTRGWFFSQLAASVSAFDQAPYKTVLMHGFTLDETGRKMSKSLGNVIEPGEVADRFGADALRWAVLSASAPWEDLRFSRAMAESAFRSLNIIYNAVRFLQGADVKVPARAPKKPRVEDRWLLSRLHAATAEVTAGLESFHLHKAARALQNFYEEDLSRWYIPMVRGRLGGGDPAAAWTLVMALETSARLLAPFVPFLAERLYLALPGHRATSVHLAAWPLPGKRQARLEEAMAVARRAVEAAWRARQKVGRKLRWPVARVTVIAEAHKALAPLRGVLEAQTNAKEILLLPSGAPLPDREAELRPLPGKIGPAFKQKAQAVIEGVKKVRPVPPSARENGLEIDIGGTKVMVSPGMFEVVERAPEGVAVEPFEGGQVAVDGRLTPELEAEGWAREVVRRVQETRKAFGLTPAVPVAASLQISDPKVARALSRFPWPERIAAGVRASRLVFGKATGRTREWDLEEWKLIVGIRK